MKWQFKRPESTIYTTLRRAFILLLVVAVVCTAAVSWLINRNSSMETSWAHDRSMLDMHSFSVNTIKNLAFSLGHQIYADNRVAVLLFGENGSPAEKYRALVQLNNYRTSIPYIESIYIYNGSTETLTVSSRHSGCMDVSADGSDSRVDPYICEKLQNLTLKDTLQPYAHVIEYEENYKPDTFCYSFFVGESIGSEPLRQAVVINFSIGWLQQILIEKQESLSETLMLEENGTVVFSSREAHLLRNLADTELFNRLTGLQSDTTRLLCEFENVRQLVTVLPKQEGNWYYVRLTPYHSVIADNNRALWLMLTIDAAMFVVYLILSVCVAKRVYVPIDRMSQELETIQDKHKELESADQKKRMLRKLLLDALPQSRETLVEEVRKTDPELNEAVRFEILILRIDKYNRFCNLYSLQERAERMEGLFRIGIEELSPYFVVRTLELGEGSNLVFVLGSRKAEPLTQSEGLAHIEAIRSAALSRLNIKFSCAVSEAATGLESLSMLYHQACDTLAYRIFEDGQCTLIAWEVQADHERDYDYPDDREDRMTSDIMNGDAEAARLEAEAILRGVTDSSLVSINLTLNRLSSALLSIVRKTEIGGFTFPPELRQRLYTASSLEEIESYETTIQHFLSAVDEMCRSLQIRHDSRYAEMVERVNEMIDETYGDPDCSLSSVAERINLSTAYLTRIYKSYTLHGIPEQIAMVRMREAKRLLREERDLTIAEISERVGYTSSSYFSKVFRKENGITPNEFRNYNTPEE